MANSRKRRHGSDAEGLQCQVCFRSYERPDYLNRHLDTHRNERPFRCNACPAGFNRRDLLLRHQATHAKHAADGQIGPNRRLGRAVKACDACVVSKARCDNAWPCRRCAKKGLICTTKNSGPRITSPSVLREERPVHLAVEAVSYASPTSDAQVLLDLYNHTLNPNKDIPSFFEQFMAYDLNVINSDPIQPPPTLTTWMPEAEWFGAVDLFSNEFAPTINRTLEDRQVLNHFFSPPSQDRSDDEVPESVPPDDGARRRPRHLPAITMALSPSS